MGLLLSETSLSRAASFQDALKSNMVRNRTTVVGGRTTEPVSYTHLDVYKRQEDMYSSNHKDSTPNIRTANSNDITIPVKPENIKEDTVISESRNSLKQAIIAQSSPIRHRTSQYRQTPVKPRINQPPRLMHASPNQIDISPPHSNSSMDRIDTGRKSLSSSSPPKVVQQSLPSVETHQTEHTSTARNTLLINGIDDSFQAISTAIRKSIAGKSALTISSSTPAKAKKSGVYEEFETKINLQPEEANRSSTIHSTALSNENTRKISASMRSSIFVGLPTSCLLYTSRCV